ncbi:hypothetical protein [Enterococcus avium]|uniref:hypothetical protein n=1 Tax=Enterococcus avium TaxID=33945 RepID=UPI003D1364CC
MGLNKNEKKEHESTLYCLFYPTVWSFYRCACYSWIIMRELVMVDRIKQGCNEEPTFGIIDSQSVKMVYPSEERGIDGGKNKG